MKTITKIFLGLGLSTTAAVGVGVPLIIIETNKKVAENNSKISLSKISPNSVQFSIPFSILKEVPNSNENKKAKITLKNGEKEVIVEDNFKIENDKIKFTLFNLEPETEYKLVKVEFNDKNKVEFLESNTTFKTVSNENETPKEKEPEKQTPEIDSTEGEKVLIPGEEKSENTDKINKEDSESKKETETKPEPEPEIKEEQPDIEDEEKEQNLPGETEENKKTPEKEVNIGNNGNESNPDSPKNNEINKKGVDSLKVGYWHLDNFSPKNTKRVQLISDVISHIKPDVILLSGMSSTSGENINLLLNALNSNNSNADWDQVSSEKGKSNQKRYTFLYKKSLLEISTSEILKSNQFSTNLSQKFWATSFQTHNGKKINFGSLVFKNQTKSKSKKRKKSRKGNQNGSQENTETNDDQVKLQLQVLKGEIEDKLKSNNFIFAATIQVENNDEIPSFSELSSSYKTLLGLNEKTKIKQGASPSVDKPSSLLLSSNDIKFNSDRATIHDIIPFLQKSQAANVALSTPITIDIDLK